MMRVRSITLAAGAALVLGACDVSSPVTHGDVSAAAPTAYSFSGSLPESAALLGTIRVCEKLHKKLTRCDSNARVYLDGTTFHLVRDNRGVDQFGPPDGVPETTSAAPPHLDEVLGVEAVFSHDGRPNVIFSGRLRSGEVVLRLATITKSGQNWAPLAAIADHGSMEVCEGAGMRRCDQDGRVFRNGTTFYLARDVYGHGGLPDVSVTDLEGIEEVMEVFAAFSFEGRPNVIFLGRQSDGSIVTRLVTTNESGRRWGALVPVFNSLPAIGRGCFGYDGPPRLERCDDEASISVTESPAGIEFRMTGDFEGVDPTIPLPDGIDETVSSLLPPSFSEFQLVAVGFLFGKPYILFSIFDANAGDRRVMIVTTGPDGRSWAQAVNAGDLS